MSELNGNNPGVLKNEMNHSNNNVENGNNPGFTGGGAVSRFITPGGNPMDTSQPAFPVFHRKFANPAPLGLLA